MIKNIKNKNGYLVGEPFLIIILVIVLIIGVQCVFLITTSYLIQERCRLSLTSLEATIIEDTYESLQDKDFDFYKSSIIDNSGNLTPRYEEIFLGFLKTNLGYDETSGNYCGEYYVIDGDSMIISVSNVETDAITITVSYDVQYMAYMPILNRQVKYFSNSASVSADYTFHELYNSEGFVDGNSDEYENKGA